MSVIYWLGVSVRVLGLGLGLGFLTIFQLYHGVTFIGGGNRSIQRKLPMQSVSVRGEVYSIQHYVIKFVSDLWQVSGFLWILRFPPPIKVTP
jgi:hypothetical protein